MAVTALTGVAAGPGVAPLLHERAVLASPATWEQLMRLQDRMNETASALQLSPGQTRDQGVASVIASPEDKHLTVYWRGPLTPAARAIIASSPVVVNVESASHTERDLYEASARVRPIADAAGIPYTSISRDEDSGGLAVSVSGTEADAQRLRQLTASLDVPVSVTPGGEVAEALADPSRMTDPSAGGAQMATDGATCSTAFAGKIQNQPVMLTADHCFPRNITDKRNPAAGDLKDVPFGTRNPLTPTFKDPYDVPYDVSALYPLSGTTFEPKIWTGAGAEESGQQKVWVNAAAQPQVGNWICNSGSRSGTTCNIKITKSEITYAATELEFVMSV